MGTSPILKNGPSLTFSMNENVFFLGKIVFLHLRPSDTMIWSQNYSMFIEPSAFGYFEGLGYNDEKVWKFKTQSMVGNALPLDLSPPELIEVMADNRPDKTEPIRVYHPEYFTPLATATRILPSANFMLFFNENAEYHLPTDGAACVFQKLEPRDESQDLPCGIAPPLGYPVSGSILVVFPLREKKFTAGNKYRLVIPGNCIFDKSTPPNHIAADEISGEQYTFQVEHALKG